MTPVCPQVTATCLSPFIFNMDLNVPSLLWWVLILSRFFKVSFEVSCLFRSPPESFQIFGCVIVDMMGLCADGSSAVFQCDGQSRCRSLAGLFSERSSALMRWQHTLPEEIPKYIYIYSHINLFL